MKNKLILASAIVAIGTLSVIGSNKFANSQSGEDKVAADSKANFEMQMLSDGSIARMNKQTGKMSLCSVKENEMICRLAVDERDAYEEEIDALNRKVAGLGGAHKSSNPDDGEDYAKINQALEFSQEAMRRFYGVIQDLRKEYPEFTPKEQETK